MLPSTNERQTHLIKHKHQHCIRTQPDKRRSPPLEEESRALFAERTGEDMG